MDYLDASQIIGAEFAANDGYLAYVDSSAAMIPPAGEENQKTAVDDILNWIANTQEEFPPENLDFTTPQESAELPQEFKSDLPTPQKSPELPQEFESNASQLPQEEIGGSTSSKSPGAQSVNPDAPKLDMLSPELKSLILWQSENEASKGEEAAKVVQAPGMPDSGTTIINPPVAAGETKKNSRKRKEIAVDVDENYEKNARLPRRSGSRASQPVAYHCHRGKKSNLSIQDLLMVIQERLPNSQKGDMATTLGEAVEYLLHMKRQELMLQEEANQLRQAMVLMYQRVQNVAQIYPVQITPLNMGVHTQPGPGGMGFRPPVQPAVIMPFMWQQNSAATPSLFVPPEAPGPSQQQRTGGDQLPIDDTQRTI